MPQKAKKPPITFPLPFVIKVNGAVIATFVHMIHALHFARDIGGLVYKFADDGRTLLAVDCQR